MLESQKGEILSPVGSKEMLYAAVRSGADAVYLGAKDFSARRNAENFDSFELKETVKYCHIRGVKVYLTLNILIKDGEFAEAVALATEAYNAGVDGVIVQDLGLADFLHRTLPELPLHASTQMSIHTPSCLPILKKLGFKQVVVAREMSFEDLKEFCREAQKYDIVVEVFVHGALCMSVSGQCLLSAYLGSRSGNRGLCAGPCRLPFKAENGTGYDLSLKDLSLIDYIPRLYEIGVRSFKIEGRMKRPEYVAAATAACKAALEKGVVDTELKNTLGSVFSRSGFTTGYLENHLGRDMFGIRTKEDVISADKTFPLLHELYRKEHKGVEISVSAKIKENEPITLTLSDGRNTVSVTGPIPQTAQKKALSYEEAKANLTKFGDTPYLPDVKSISLDEGLFVPASVLNALRREACEKLDDVRGKINRQAIDIPQIPLISAENSAKTPDIIIRVENIQQIPQDLSNIKAVIVPLENDFEKTDGVINIVDIPRGIISEKTIENRLTLYKSKGFDICLCGNLSAIEIAQKLDFKIIADTGLNIYNSHSAMVANKLGADAVVLSTELTADAVKNLYSPIPKGIITYGNIPLMLFKNCPLKNGKDCSQCNKTGFLTDRMGIKFPVRCRLGYSELLNSVPLWLGDKSADLSSLDFQLLYFTNETADETRDVISAFKNGKPAAKKYTRGLFYKGTI